MTVLLMAALPDSKYSCDMLRALNQSWTGILLAITLVVASFQFAQHSVRAEAIDPDLLAFLAIGGSLEELCTTDGDIHAHGDCPFCRELDVLAVPRNTGANLPFLAEASVLFAILRAHELTLEQALRPPARAPPAA